MNHNIRIAAAAAILAASATQTQAGSRAVACYQPVHQPAQYRTVTETVLVSAGERHVETIPAEYGWREKQVQVRGERISWRTIPAEYRTVSEEVLLEPARTVARTVPARTALVHKKVKVSDGGYAWEWKVIKGKKTLCKVKTKPVWGTVAERIVVEPERTVHETVPARYGIRTKNVLVTSARKERVVEPAIYDTVREKVLVRAGSSRVIETPAVYETVTRRIKTRDAVDGWKQVAIPRHCK